MTTINHLAKGQSDWQETLNAAFDELNDLAGGSTVNCVNNPVTALNGATIGSSVIYWTQLDGYKAVWLALSDVTYKTVTDDQADGYLQLPNNFKPSYRLYFPGNQNSIFGYAVEADKMYIFTSESGTVSSLFGNTCYLVKDN